MIVAKFGSKSGQKAMRACSFLLLACLVAAYCVLPTATQAQSFFGTLIGSVTDASGAAIPGASVTATNTGTNEKRTVQSNAVGEYRIPALIPATYKIEVQAKSFKRFLQDSITVPVDTAIRVNAALEVGEATETVEVTSQAPLLQTESGSVGSQVEGKIVQEMPLNGRNAMNLLALVPGVVPQQSTSGAPAGNAGIHTYVNGWGNYSIGGGIANESANYIDGAGNNMLGGNSPALIMTQDMVQEFKVESGAVSAEYGHFGGGVVNMTSKSGGNAWHGSLYEYVRNTILNANDFLANNTNAKLVASGNAPLAKSPFHQNQYGATFSGPIKKDKAFFMFSWENYSLHKTTSTQFFVPTKAMRGEDTAFPGYAIVSKAVPTTNCPGILTSGDAGFTSAMAAIGGAAIPTSCISKVANIMKGFYAYPNASLGSKNFAGQPMTGDDAYQYNVRVDFNLSANQRIFGRYTKWHMQDIGEDDFKGRAGNSVPSDFGATGNLSNNIVIGDTYTINNSTIADVRIAYMRDHFWNYGSAQSSFDVSKFGTSAWTALGPQLSYKETPIFGLIGGEGFSGPWNIPVGANQVDIFEAFSLNYNLTKIAGNHTFKMGGESMLRNHSGIGNYAWDAGQTMYFGFGPTSEWAGFMLGDFAFDNFHTVKNSFTLNKTNGLFVTDTWRVNSKLTLNLGLRWDIPGGIYEKKDRATVFMPEVVDTNNGLPGALALTNSPLYKPRSVSPVKWNLFGPRVSFAYTLNSSTALRGGFGISSVPPDMPIGLMAFNSPVSGVDTFCPGGVAGNNWDNPCAHIGNKLIQPLGRTDMNPSHVFYNQMLQSPVPTTKFPYMSQWNFALSKQWKGDLLTEFQYVGSKGTHLPSSGVGTGTGGSFTSINQLDPKYYYMGKAALSATAACGKLGATASVAQCLQPFPQYSGVLDTGTNGGGQTYEAMSLVVSKRFTSGSVVNANYTFAHTVGDTDQPGFGGGGNVQNFYNMKAEKAIASFDVKHRMIFSYVLNMPFGKGQKWLNQGGATNAILGGWQVSGIGTLQSGFPYSFSNTSSFGTLFQSGNSFGNAWGAGTARPNIVAGCNLNTSLSYLEKFNQKKMFNKECLVPAGFSTYAEYQAYLASPSTFDPTGAIMDKRALMFGNAPRNTDAVRGQKLVNFDLTVGKNIAITERFKLIFKAEIFNIFNHPVFMNGVSALGDGNLGYVGQTATANTQRLTQLSLRLNF